MDVNGTNSSPNTGLNSSSGGLGQTGTAQDIAAQTPDQMLAQQARTGTPVEQGQALQQLDQMTGNKAATDALTRSEEAQAKGQTTTEHTPEMCTVEVRYKPVIGPTNHAFIVTTDADSTNYFRGGPAGNGFGSGSSGSGATSASSNTSGGDNANRGWGNIVTEYGAYQPGTVDWTTNPTGQQTVHTQAGNCDAIETQMAQRADAIEAANVPYSPFGPNSNTTVRDILDNSGFTDVNPVVWSPGWNDNMPVGQ
ncbi:hypothetical protein [Parasphingorhabdus cellanae]|uniref:Uncharacterized protein n=1 Tax=Parasphingorhabdus cellanae TaxID=2806553 RepID=A0ABX7T1Y6_9SPHN|nr:hypothetical protein [Parasphingorhabdus cellanae]QTD54542.1 hypothetical protein J4G78_09590 [Parasphingorhabdus cellanae]